MINQVIIVLAKYCPHCLPFTLQNAEKMAEAFRVPLRVLDIEIPEQEDAADRLVEEHGDWSEDYLIPQVFVEYADGRVDHILTGFSEAVSVTEASWEALFSSNYYLNLLREQATQRMSLKEFVEKYLSFKGRCRRHCDEPTSLVDLWSDSDGVVGAYVCPDGYASRVIYFSVNPDINWFKSFLTSQVGEKRVNDRNIRPATRHGWELGNDALFEIGNVDSTGKITEVYWTIYPKTEEERSWGVFLCYDPEGKRGCRRLFVQDIKSRSKLCPKCS